MEVVATVGNAILSSFVEGMLDKLSFIMELNKFSGEESIFEEINNWKKQLKKFYAVLDDAMEKQWGNQLVQTWVCDLRDLAYDVEDVLDELNTEAQRRKLEEKAEAQRSKVRRIISTVHFSAQINFKVKSIGDRFHKIFTDKDHRHSGGSGTSHVKERQPTSSILQEGEAKIYGRDKDKEEILQLLKVEASDVNVSVVSIIGMGGIGKTTLAQLIYNDTSLEFDFKTWVSVGDDFDVLKITKTILQATESDVKDDLNLNQMKLKEKLQSKKCLIVLDDVWNKSYDKWKLFYGPLLGCALGSKILVTSRDKSVSQMMDSLSAYSLKELSEEDCLSVFAQHALGVVNFDNHLPLKDIGTGIVRRCRGLPLAAKALGGLLKGEQDRRIWQGVLSSNIWDLSDDKCSILPALRLSYFHLPSNLKQCFAYCAVFPKDFEFDREELVLLWMAEGFISQPQKMQQLEYFQCFDALLSRSFFQVSSSHKSRYVMHDLMHDLAQSVSGETCFHLGEELRNTDQHSMIRHSSFMSGHRDTWKKFEGFSEMKNLRTFLALPILPKRPTGYLTSKVLHDMVPKLRSLRVLSLASYHIELPSNIGELKLLRYLNFSYTDIERLPESFVNLLNLQTLRLRGCYELTELPIDMGKLINLQILDVSMCSKLSKLPLCISSLTNLQSLDVSDTKELQEMPPQIGNLINLKLLNKFIVGKDNGVKLTELKKFAKLEGKLCIVDLQNVVDMQDAEIADLKEKHGIEELELEWRGSSRNASDEEVKVLNSLRPHQNVSRFSIEGFAGSEFPSWIGDPTFNKMVKLTLCSCKKIKRLPPLGQISSLRELSIESMDGVKGVGVELYGNGSSCFVSLERLIIKNMEEWVQWTCIANDHEDASVKFPKLSDLKVINCPKLVGKLPMHLPSLQKLHIEGCQEILLRSSCDFPSLTHLEIRKISGLLSLDEMHIEDMVALQDLEIEECDQLVSLVEGEEGKLPCNLQVLWISRCNNLEKLANGLHLLKCLRELTIRYCYKLKSFPAEGAPYGLKKLGIYR